MDPADVSTLEFMVFTDWMATRRAEVYAAGVAKAALAEMPRVDRLPTGLLSLRFIVEEC